MNTLITGASSGIGYRLAKLAIEEGHTVIVNARRADQLDLLKKIAPERVLIVAGDVTQKDVQQKLVGAAQSLGHIDYLVNNAGFGYFGALEKQTNVPGMIDLNITALIELTRQCLPLLKRASRGRILNIASVLGRIELPFMAAYIASKYAVVGFTRGLNLELAGTAVTATAVCPSGVKTEFSDVAVGSDKAHKANRFAEPVERVTQNIWKKRDTCCEVLYPTWNAAFTARATMWTRPLSKMFMRGLVKRKGENLL